MNSMSKEPRDSSPSLTQEDVSRLRQTATDAVNDMDFTGAARASEAKSPLKELVQHFQGEGSEKFQGILNTSRDFISKRPLFCVGAALAVGILIGLSRRDRSRN
jgi:ElaB/YqjD/DUF883 family membrane-anchored ribosome-binding protein